MENYREFLVNQITSDERKNCSDLAEKLSFTSRLIGAGFFIQGASSLALLALSSVQSEAYNDSNFYLAFLPGAIFLADGLNSMIFAERPSFLMDSLDKIFHGKIKTKASDLRKIAESQTKDIAEAVKVGDVYYTEGMSGNYFQKVPCKVTEVNEEGFVFENDFGGIGKHRFDSFPQGYMIKDRVLYA